MVDLRFCLAFSRPIGAHGFKIAASQGLRFASSLGLVLVARWAARGGRVGIRGRDGLVTVGIR